MPDNEQPSILLVGSGIRTSLENMYLRAFKKNGYTNIDLFALESVVPSLFRRRFLNRLTLPLQHARITKNFLTYLREHYSEYDFIIVFKGMQFSRTTLEACRESAGKALWVNINPDDPFNTSSPGASNLNVLESIAFYDLYCIWSRRLVDRLRSYGARKVLYFPFGFDDEFHKPVPCVAQKLAEVSFVGSWDRERERILSELTEYNLVIYGNGWDNLHPKSPLQQKVRKYDLFGEDLARVIGESAVSLNLLRAQNEGSHNMRTFEIPAMAGLMLTTRTEEQQGFFPENEACYMYGDVEELKAKINYILTHKHEADQFRNRGMEMVQEQNYTSRAQQLVKMLSM